MDDMREFTFSSYMVEQVKKLLSSLDLSYRPIDEKHLQITYQKRTFSLFMKEAHHYLLLSIKKGIELKNPPSSELTHFLNEMNASCGWGRFRFSKKGSSIYLTFEVPHVSFLEEPLSKNTFLAALDNAKDVGDYLLPAMKKEEESRNLFSFSPSFLSSLLEGHLERDEENAAKHYTASFSFEETRRRMEQYFSAHSYPYSSSELGYSFFLKGTYPMSAALFEEKGRRGVVFYMMHKEEELSSLSPLLFSALAVSNSGYALGKVTYKEDASLFAYRIILPFCEESPISLSLLDYCLSIFSSVAERLFPSLRKVRTGEIQDIVSFIHAWRD